MKIVRDKRIDPRYYALQYTKQENDKISFFIYSTHPLTQDEIEKLKGVGCSKVLLTAENMSVATATAKFGLIPKIAALGFVFYVDIAKQMQ